MIRVVLLLSLKNGKIKMSDTFEIISFEIQWEKKPLLEIAQDGQLAAYRHHGFWKPMDALRDRIELEGLWNSGKSPWKVW